MLHSVYFRNKWVGARLPQVCQILAVWIFNLVCRVHYTLPVAKRPHCHEDLAYKVSRVAFATDGLMTGDLPNLNQPALALAATGQESSNPLALLLTLEDVLTLKLNADWVVLSACNTAAAGGKAEEALSGLARGFFYAGSRSLLVTHWAVESESAKLLTTNTFAHYAEHPEAPKAESLRQAMLPVMEKPEFAHPAYWAPYALVGDGGR